MDELVSVRIVTFNHECFISKTIDSVLAQTYENIEICISDDCSKDRTVEIIKKYQREYPNKIKLFVQPINMGQHSTLINANKSREMCSGKYIANLNGDDLMEPTRIKKQLEFLKNTKAIATYHRMKVFNVRQNTYILDHPWTKSDHNVTTKKLIIYGNSVYNPTLMYKNVHNITGDIALKRMGDLFIITQLSLKGKILFQDEFLTQYNIHDNNLTKKAFTRDKLITLALLEYYFPYLRKYINIKRASFVLSSIKENKKNIKYLFTYGFRNTALAVWYIIKKYIVSKCF
tara:strand:- start:279 stop:1142 length:864 start_codon:yes stop_codon:yes gene_type:complete